VARHRATLWHLVTQALPRSPRRRGQGSAGPPCPLRVICGHRLGVARCPLLDPERTSFGAQATSAFDPKRTCGAAYSSDSSKRAAVQATLAARAAAVQGRCRRGLRKPTVAVSQPPNDRCLHVR
jgi:hypothetical protein